MAITFPTTPTIGQQFTSGTSSWEWNGTAWLLIPRDLTSDPNKVTANASITGATKTKITYDSKGLVTNGEDLAEADIPALSIAKITNLQTELNGKQPTLVSGTNIKTINGSTLLGTGNLVISSTATLQNVTDAGNETNDAIKIRDNQLEIIASGGTSSTFSGTTQGTAAGQYNSVYGITADADGNIYVCDQANYRIKKIPPAGGTGTVIYGGNGPGAGLNQLASSAGWQLAVYNGLLYVPDPSNNRVLRMGLDGSNPEVYLAIGNIYYIAFDSFGAIYCGGVGTHTIVKYPFGSSTPTTVAGFGGYGSGTAQITNPGGICVDDQDRLYVADTGNHRIMRYNYGVNNGVLVAGGNGAGNNSNQLFNPANVAVRNDNYSIYIHHVSGFKITQWENGASTGTLLYYDSLNSSYGDMVLVGSTLYFSQNNHYRVYKLPLDSIVMLTNQAGELYSNDKRVLTEDDHQNLGTVMTEYADNAAAIAAGKVIGDLYRTGDLLKIVHA